MANHFYTHVWYKEYILHIENRNLFGNFLTYYRDFTPIYDSTPLYSTQLFTPYHSGNVALAQTFKLQFVDIKALFINKHLFLSCVEKKSLATHFCLPNRVTFTRALALQAELAPQSISCHLDLMLHDYLCCCCVMIWYHRCSMLRMSFGAHSLRIFIERRTTKL